MTTIISRLYADASAARSVYRKLQQQGFRDRDIDLIANTGDADTSKIERRLRAAMVHEDAAPTYAASIASGNAVVVARADYTPLGARRIARETFDESKAIPSGASPEDHFVKTPVPKSAVPKVLDEHPLFLRSDRDPGTGREIGLISDFVGISTLSRRERKNSTIETGPLTGSSTLSRGERKKSVIEGGGTILSNAIGWKTVKRRAR